MYTIYMHTLPNGKSYIGQTCKTIKQRINGNFTGYKGSTAFDNAIKKYGADSITTTILYQCETVEEADRLEIQAIKEWNTLSPNGYNLKTGGNNGRHSPETRRRIRESNQGNAPTYGMRGKKHSPETRKKLSEIHTGRKHTEEARRKIGEAGKRRKHSKETRQRLSEQKKGEKNPFYGKKLSPEHRRKMSESRKGRRHSPETRQRIKDAWKRRKARENNNPSQLRLF